MAVTLLMCGKYSGRCFSRAFSFEHSMPAVSVFIRLPCRARACIPGPVNTNPTGPDRHMPCQFRLPMSRPVRRPSVTPVLPPQSLPLPPGEILLHWDLSRLKFSMKIILNNKNEVFSGHSEMTVDQLLKLKNFTFPMIIIKINGMLIRKENYPETLIREGDNVTALHLISGG